jgi:hypothetical protein
VRDLEDIVACFPDGVFDRFLLGPAPLEQNTHHTPLRPDVDLRDVVQPPYFLPYGLQAWDLLILGLRNPHHHIRHDSLPLSSNGARQPHPYTQLRDHVTLLLLAGATVQPDPASPSGVCLFVEEPADGLDEVVGSLDLGQVTAVRDELEGALFEESDRLACLRNGEYPVGFAPND